MFIIKEFFMKFLYLFIVIILIITQDITKKQYNIKVKKTNGFIFSAIVALFAMLFFFASAGFKLNITAEVIPYSLGFALTYSAALVGTVLAIKWGPLSITLLVISYSLIIPAFYGIIALGEKLTPIKILGLILLAVSLLLISNVLDRKKEAKALQEKISLRWLIALFFAFAGNGLCSTVQKMQQIALDGNYKSEFMIIALAISFVALVIVSIINKEDVRVDTLPCVGFAAITGIANGVVNLLVMVLSAPGMMDASILFPTISGGGIVLGFVFAIFVYKEKLSVPQYIGYAIGTASVILLNI